MRLVVPALLVALLAGCASKDVLSGTCGNGNLDPGESCDVKATALGVACPTFCLPSDACATAELVGQGCEQRCVETPITEPAPGDGCCPSGASEDTDADCPPDCGNGLLDDDELCDTAIASGQSGACPTSCTAVNTCHVAALSGSACAQSCVETLVVASPEVDGCCPLGAVPGDDPDCGPVCAPATCSELEQLCGSFDDGCGGVTDCGVCLGCGEILATYAGFTQDLTFTDPPDCSGCPASFIGFTGFDVASTAATTISATGSVAGADSCCWSVESEAAQGGMSTSGEVTPELDGTLQLTVPLFCGDNVVRVACSNGAGRSVLVRHIASTQCAERDLQVTLAWDEHGSDLELHLVRDAGGINTADDCTWFNCVAPETVGWSVDPNQNPTKDCDDTDLYGPENIYYNQALAGTYHVLVEYWGTGTVTRSTVDITVGDSGTVRLTQQLTPQEVWYVGSVSFPAASLAVVDTVTGCAASWGTNATTGYDGCLLALP